MVLILSLFTRHVCPPDPLSSHSLAPVFSLFVPFYLLIPRMPVTQVLGHIHITNKSLVYIVGLQVSPCSASVGRNVSLNSLSFTVFELIKKTVVRTSLIFSVFVFFSPAFVAQLLTSSPFMWLLALSGLVSCQSLLIIYSTYRKRTSILKQRYTVLGGQWLDSMLS